MSFMALENIIDNIKIITVNFSLEEEKRIRKEKGNYITIEFSDITEYNNSKKVEELIINELKKMFNILNIKDKGDIFVIRLEMIEVLGH